MPTRKTYKQKQRDIEQKYKKQEYDMRMRIELKYKEKAEKEFEKKVKRLHERKERALHNLKVEEGEAHPNAKKKPIKKKRPSTDYANACKLAQLIAKLRDTDDDGYGECICCPGSRFSWEQLDGGHFIPKKKSRATALELININAQSKKCNSSFGGAGRYDAQKPQIEKKRGKAKVSILFKKKEDMQKIYPKEFIKNHIQLARQLLLKKKFDTSSYEKFLDVLEKRYM